MLPVRICAGGGAGSTGVPTATKPSKNRNDSALALNTLRENWLRS